MLPEGVVSGLIRGLVALMGALMIVAGLAGLVLHAATLAPVVGGSVLVVGVLFERWRYKPLQARPAVGFEPTGERFLDPASRKRVSVYADPETGERRYVEDAGP